MPAFQNSNLTTFKDDWQFIFLAGGMVGVDNEQGEGRRC